MEQQIESDVLDAAGSAAEGGGGSSGLPVAALLKLLETPAEHGQLQQDPSTRALAAASSNQGAADGDDPAHDYTSYLKPYVRACLFGSGVSRRKLKPLVAFAQQQKGRLERLQAVAGGVGAILREAYSHMHSICCTANTWPACMTLPQCSFVQVQQPTACQQQQHGVRCTHATAVHNSCGGAVGHPLAPAELPLVVSLQMW